MNKKTIITVIIVLIFAIAGGVWYYQAHMHTTSSSTPFLTPPQSPTATTSSSIIVYVNNEYGFTFTLPASWQGYSIVASTWTGYTTPVQHGPMLSIRNPLWASSTPTQDIPIMVFTLSEWSAVASGTMPVGAAPIPPSELGQNARYVFALPARYNYAFPQGWQEVQSIIQSNPLHVF